MTFPRDIRYAHWHKTVLQFRITQGPEVEQLGTSSARISWTMSETAATGQIEYGQTTGYGNTSTEQTDLATFTQNLANLNANTTYHFRVKAVSYAGTTVYSDDFTFRTEGASAPSTVGPEYGPASWPSRETTSFPTWPTVGGAVVMVPQSVVDAPDTLGAWLSSTTNVPNGSTVVFDRTEGGAGTTYTFTDTCRVESSTTRSNITFHAYNATFTYLRDVASPYTSSPRVFRFVGAGWSNFEWKGGEIIGCNEESDNNLTYIQGAQSGHGISWASAYDDITFRDIYVHDMCGDGILLEGFQMLSADFAISPGGGSFGDPTQVTFTHLHIKGCGRQGLVCDYALDYDVTYNIIEDIGLLPVDSEEGTPDCAFANISITDNLIRRWGLHLATDAEIAATPLTDRDNYWYSAGISQTKLLDEAESPIVNLDVSRNVFEYGSGGWGDPAAEAAYEAKGGDWPYGKSDGYAQTMRWKQSSTASNRVRWQNVTITDNVFALDPSQDVSRQDSRENFGGYAVAFYNADGITISGNDFGNRGIYLVGCTSVSVSGVNGWQYIDGAWTAPS